MRLLTLLLFVCAGPAWSQDTSSIQSFSLYSSTLKEQRQFTIYLPSLTKDKPEVIYVLDGQALFNEVVHAMKALRKTQKIVVGIGNIWLRDRDYTPTHITAAPFLTPEAAAVSGGGPKFIDHLKNELIPYINSHYAVDSSDNMLIGHSLGGLTAITILYSYPNLFSKYAVIDPAMWWDDGKFAKQTRLLPSETFNRSSLFLAIANTRDHAKNDIEEIRKDTTPNTALIRPSLVLLDYLKESSKNNGNVAWSYYKDYDHMSVFAPAIKDGLKFLLK
jgi:predicted alpha/beta superfamily hydrolase